MHTPLHRIAALGLLLALAACGGGSESAPAAEDPLAAVPTEAQQSATALAGYLQKMTQAADAEAREGIDLGAVMLGTSDTTEPVELP